MATIWLTRLVNSLPYKMNIISLEFHFWSLLMVNCQEAAIIVEVIAVILKLLGAFDGAAI